MVKLVDICDLKMGQSPNSSSYNQEGLGIPFYQGNADFGDINPETRYYCNKPTKIAKKDDILLSVRAPIGAINIAIETCCIGRGLAALTAKTHIADTKYLYYILKMKNVELNQKGTGSTFKAINKQNLSEILCPLPPLETQKQIAKTLDTAAELLAMRKQQLAELDNLIKSTFYDMFGDPVSNSTGQTIVKLQSLIKNKNDLVDGPFGSSVNTKIDYVDNGEIPVIRTKNVNNLEFVTEDLKFMTRDKYETVIRSQVLPNDIILTKVGTIGNLCIFPDIYPEAVLSTTGSCRIRANKELMETKFLLYYLHFYKPKMLEIASTGVQAFLNMNHIKSFDVFKITLLLQTQFANIVTKIEEQKALVKRSIDETQHLFDSLMSEYFE